MTLQKLPIPGPYKGVITDLPSATDNQAFDDIQNFFCRKGRIQTRPQWTPLSPTPDDEAIETLYSFQDAFNNWHTLVITTSNAYMITTISGAVVSYQALTLPSGIPTLAGTGLPYGYLEMNSAFYFCNGSTPLLYADGSANVYVAGDVPGAPYYLTQNSFSLIGANWTKPAPGIVGSANYPFLVSWSDTANPNSWTPSNSSVAGSSDLIMSGGGITGLGTIGRNTYVLSQFGAQVMYPTGQAQPAFDFEPFMWSKPGWGNYYPYSLVVWGPLMFTITQSAEVLMFDGSNFTQLAKGKIRGKLQQQLTNVSPNDVRCWCTSTMGPGYDLEAYWISLPNGTIWVHDLVEGTWQRMFSTNGRLTALGVVVTE